MTTTAVLLIDCPDRKGPHVHMPNWDAKGGSLVITALVNIETGLEISGSRSNETRSTP